MTDDILFRIDDALAANAETAFEPGSIEQLALLLRAEAPVARPDFIASLDKRVERGFRSELLGSSGADPIWPWSPMLARLTGGMRRRPVGVAFALTVIALVGVGIVASSPSMERDESATSKRESTTPTVDGHPIDQPPRPADYAAEPLADGEAHDERADLRATSKGGSGSSATTAVSGTITDYRVHILGSGLFLAVEPKHVPGVVADATKVARDLGGYPGSSSYDVDGDTASGTADLWVPTDRHADAMAGLAKLGRVERTTQASRDITASRADLVSEIRTNRALLREYTRGSDGKPNPQTDAIKNQLELRQQRLANLDKRVDMTLINVKVRGVEPEPKAPPASWSIEWAVDTAGDSVRRMAALIIVLTGVVLLPAVVAGAAWLAISGRRRRLRDSVLDDD